ncbi:uncharacterized protein [Lolium perenne]|uniref:uncharacterized protein isoform X1 n=1 Tax=Lolium perenne TaxID=4522 RepID=UPI003A9A3FA3
MVLLHLSIVFLALLLSTTLMCPLIPNPRRVSPPSSAERHRRARFAAACGATSANASSMVLLPVLHPSIAGCCTASEFCAPHMLGTMSTQKFPLSKTSYVGFMHCCERRYAGRRIVVPSSGKMFITLMDFTTGG